MMNSRTKWLLAAGILTIVTACGGGGGGSASGGQPPPVTGMTTTVFVTGAISGFGSVIVNGVHFESDSATVTLEGHAGSVDQLKAGDVVHLTADVDSQGHAHARTIDQGRLSQGVVQAVDVAAGTLTIAGQVIQVDGTTLFDESIPGGTLAGIAVGDRIEVHGFVGGSGVAQATRVAKADAGDDEIEVTGPLAALDAAARRFTVGALVVDYSTATLDGFPATGPADGDIVEARGMALLADGALEATRVSREDGGLDGRDGDGGELEGLVTRFVSAADFDVSGQIVTTTSATVFVGGTPADLKLDAKLEVEGTLDATGTLVAEKVAFKQESSLQASAMVDAVDSNAGTLTALGITFVVTTETRVEDEETDNHFFKLADLHAGDWVELSGYPDPAGTGRIVATRFERHKARSDVELSGPVETLAPPAFTIAGASVETTSSTEFEDGASNISSDDFFAGAAGKRVKVEGTWNGVAPLIADRVQIDESAD